MLISKWWAFALSCVLVLVAQDAVASRLAWGEPGGKAVPSVWQRSALAPASVPVAPTFPAAGNAAGSLAPKSLWGAVTGGAAAALGLAWLASVLGFGEAVAQFLLVGLVVVSVLAVVGLLRRRRGAVPTGQTLQAAARGGASGAGAGDAQRDAVTPRGYSPQNVGNDASARPWEQPAVLPEGVLGAVDDATPGWGVPEGFDTAGFLKASKANFVSLQAAWDRSDIPALRAMMTDSMIEQIQVQLGEREQVQGLTPNQTDVVMLEARLLGIEDVGAGYMASVEFSGLIREEPSAGPNPFREVWSITRDKTGQGGWLVAGVQALQ